MKWYSIKKKICKYLYKFAIGNNFRVSLLKRAGYKIGNKTRVSEGLFISDLSEETANVVLGDRVNIAHGVTIVTSSSPNTSKLYSIYGIITKKVIINNDVWIGSNATILPGVIIGKCSVIGAGAVVDKKIPPYSIVIGNPSKILKMSTDNINLIEKGVKNEN